MKKKPTADELEARGRERAENPIRPPDLASEDPPKPTYEFKILPVDPKNSFDFEDVADK